MNLQMKMVKEFGQTTVKLSPQYSVICENISKNIQWQVIQPQIYVKIKNIILI